MIPLQLLSVGAQSYAGSCIFGGTPNGMGGLNTGNWIQINLIVILLSFTISALVYSLAGVFPVSMREKMKGAAKFEAFQGIVSIAVILALIAFSSLSCSVGQGIVASSVGVTGVSYQNPMQYSEGYISNLMFTKGLGLFTQIYAESVLIAVSANLATTIDEALSQIAINPYLAIDFNPDFFGALFGFSGAIAASFEPLIVVTFGILFLLYLLLPIVQALALTVVVPVALIMRSIPYAGPKLRESSDSFLALSIGFYFILPMAILLNSFIISWIFFTPCSAASTSICNPYQQYTVPYQISSFPTSALFNSQPQTISSGGPLGDISLPESFLGSGIAATGGLASGLLSIFTIVINLPSVIIGLGLKTAEYVFEGIVLIGIDMAITLGFAQGLTKGLNSAGKMLGVGPFWGNV